MLRSAELLPARSADDNSEVSIADTVAVTDPCPEETVEDVVCVVPVLLLPPHPAVRLIPRIASARQIAHVLVDVICI